MEVSEGKLYLQNLEEEVIEQNNIITYKWLMKTLKVTSNVAKQMLYEFVEKQKAYGIALNVTYLVAGQRKGDSNTMVHEICIVPACQLDSTKSKFYTVTSVHIYGVHKDLIQDHSVLYATDYYSKGNAMEDIKKGCKIQCRAVNFRNIDLVDELSSSISQESPIVTTQEERHKPVIKHQAPLPKSKILNSKKGSGSNGALASMFQNMEKKKQVELIKNEVNESTASQQSKSDKEHKTLISDKKGAKLQTLILLNTGSEKSTPDHTRVTSRTIEKPMAKREPEKRRKTNTENNSVSKKRRRIIEISESSSEDDEESQSPIPSPPPHPAEVQFDDLEEPLSPRMELKENIKGVRRKRKLVEDMVEDQDGYLVIQKKWTEVDASEGSDDENEEIPPLKTNPATNCTNTATNPSKTCITKNKQATLTNFFKRK